MRKLALLFLFFVFSCSTDDSGGGAIIGQQDAAFLGELDRVQSFGGSGEDTPRDVIGTSDGGYAVLGFSNSTDGDLQGKNLPVMDYWLLKFDSEGDLQWNKTYGGSGEDLGQSLIQTNDGGYALTGYAQSADGDGSNNNGFHDNWIIKLDASGTIEWERSFGFSGHDHSYDILQTEDGGFFFVGFLDITSARADGYTEKGGSLTRHGVGEFWGTKIDAQGDIEWRRYFGGTNNDRAHAVVQSEDGGFVMAGFTESNDFDIKNSRGSYDFWVLKIDNSGNLVWERSFGGSGIEIAYDISKTNDNGFVITGNTFSDDGDVSTSKGESDIWLIKIDDGGNLLWEKTYGGTQFDAAQSVQESADGGFIITGNSKSTDVDLMANVGENDLWLIKTDALGNLVWQKSFGGNAIDFGFDAVENADRSIILVGETSSTDFLEFQNKGKSDVVVLKIK
ncbi:hypothetical protein [Maribacter halichondriae]|uniref:hypothetical protein n=1 Tax=Maribacter halichondriae TaxID=2980554 RepID=UPI0023582331|nr:hypothetical protein [Maribacter sp. Hal144]